VPRTYEELNQERTAAHSAIFGRLFDLGKQAKEIPGPQLSDTVRQSLTPQQISAMRARSGEEFAQNRAAEEKALFEQVEEEYQEGLAARREEIMDALFGGAQEQDASTMLRYASASESQLRAALEMAQSAENHEVLQMVTLAAYERDMGAVLDRVHDLIPETGDLLGELAAIEMRIEDLDDADTLWETLAPEIPDAQKILTR